MDKQKKKEIKRYAENGMYDVLVEYCSWGCIYYWKTKGGYYYRTADGKRRISKQEYENAKNSKNVKTVNPNS